MRRSVAGWAAMMICGMLVVPAAAHEGDFFVGQSAGAGATSGQLAVEFDDTEPYELPIVTVFPGDGFGADEPGFANLDVDEADENFFMLAGNPHIAIELVSFAPAMVLYNDPPLNIELQNPGDQFELPSGISFDHHGFWFVDDPDFSELGEVFDFNFKAVDLNGQYTDSPIYTAQFTTVPEPTALGMLGMGAAAAGLRRRRHR